MKEGVFKKLFMYLILIECIQICLHHVQAKLSYRRITSPIPHISVDFYVLSRTLMSH